MATISETLLTINTHIGDNSNIARTITGEKYKGDGYYGRSDGLHTVQITINEFIGKIELQGTLESDPTEQDWFTVELGTGAQSVDTTGLLREQNITSVDYIDNTTNTKTYNFIGNYVWIRAKVSNWTDGTINSIQLNH